MRKILFNDNWTYFKKGEENFKQNVMLPHDAMVYEKRNQAAEGGLNIGWFEAFDYVYEKEFELPDVVEGSSFVFEFEGVYKNAEVYINDNLAAQRPYGYTNFYADATKFLKKDAINTIKVIASNSDQPNSRWYTGSGIYRPVNLYTLPKKHILINGLKIRTLSFEPAVIEINLKTNLHGAGKIEIFDGENVIKSIDFETDGEYKKTVEIENAKLWDCENPNLYVCRASFDNDEFESTFGIRTIECNAKDGFKINGKRVIMRGACFHHDNGLLGAAGHPFAEERKVKLLKEAGYNALRSAHNPCSKAVLDACDKLGVLMLDEYVDMWYIHKTKYDYSNYFAEWWKQDLTDMVDKDYNHPSVIMYSIGNEVAETGQEKGIAFTEEMTAFLHSLDSRPVTCGINIFFNFLYSMGFGVYSDKKANKAAKKSSNPAKKEKKHTIGSEFFNQLAGIVGDDFMKFGATLRGSDRKTRGAFAKLDVAGYNYGILRYKKDVKKYPDRVILGTETFCRDTYKFYEFAKKNPALIGDFVWAGMDYLGEAGIGAWEYDTYAKDFGGSCNWISAGSGRLDLTGRGSGEAAYTKVAYEQEKIAIAVVPVDRAFHKHSPSAWKMTNAKLSWSWQGCEGNKTIVEVYARAFKVVLFINGRKAGEKKAKKDCRFRFKVRYLPGKITAVAYDRDGLELYRTSLVSAGPETKLALFPECDKISLNDLCYVRLKYTDNSGILKPLARGDIKIEVSNGTLLGLGNACSYNENGFVTDTTDAYYGEALAIIRPKNLGEINITAQCPYGSVNTIVKTM